MPSVLLMEFDKEKRGFYSLQEAELSSVPTAGDKVIVDIDGIGYIFKVYDTHYSPDNRTDVNIIRISTSTDYYSSDYPDIK